MEFQNLAAFVLLLGALVFVHELGTSCSPRRWG